MYIFAETNPLKMFSNETTINNETIFGLHHHYVYLFQSIGDDIYQQYVHYYELFNIWIDEIYYLDIVYSLKYVRKV